MTRIVFLVSRKDFEESESCDYHKKNKNHKNKSQLTRLPTTDKIKHLGKRAKGYYCPHCNAGYYE